MIGNLKAKLRSILRTKGNQRGFTLLEVVIAMVLMGMVGTTVLLALNTSSKTIATSNELTIAESLTRTTIEFVKRSPYDNNVIDTPVYDSQAFSEGVPDAIEYETLLGLGGDPYYGDYTVNVNVDRLDPEADGTLDDDGIQKITVEIQFGNRTILSTESYKVSR
ncbi:prepilin-type N-terminal cleavage/methylation domain-containing protein [Chloroflexota bacterium]